MPDQTTGRPTDDELRQIAEDPWVSYAPETPRHMAIELREQRARIAELETAAEAKRAEHAVTLGFLETAHRVIEQDSAKYGSLLRTLWASRRAWQASHDAARDIAISNSHALDAAQAEIDQLRSGLEAQVR